MPRYSGTGDPSLIAALVRSVNQDRADQSYEQFTCGPEPYGTLHFFQFVFKATKQGRTLGRASEEAPFGVCDTLGLRVGGRGPYGLEVSGELLHLAHGLIRRARPR